MTFLRMPDRTVVHVRMSLPRSRRCTVCKLQTVPSKLRECDFNLENGTTCDRLMCERCAHRTAPGFDLCPQHREVTTRRRRAVPSLP